MRTLRACFLVSTGLLVLATARPAIADFFVLDSEPNNTLASAQSLPVIPIAGTLFTDLGVVEGSISPGDVDFFQIHFPQPVIYGAGVSQLPAVPSFVGFFDSAGNLLDSEGIVNGIIDPGTYTVAVTGAGDLGFTGAHAHEFEYQLVISWLVIPSPSALALLVAGTLLGRRRRREAR